MRRGRCERDAGRDLEAHNQDSQSLSGIVGDQMLDTRSQIHKIIRAQGMRFIAVSQSARALQNKINLFFTVVQNILALALGINRNFCEARYASQNSIVRVTCPEDRLVVAGSGGWLGLRLAHMRQVPMQPRGVNFPILGREIRDQQQE
jgi:hypothetical protein